MLISVDLPAPLGPSRPVTPGPRCMVTSLTATTLPYQRETCSSSSVLMRGPRGIVGWRSEAGEARDSVGCSRQGLPVAGQQDDVRAGDHRGGDQAVDRP